MFGRLLYWILIILLAFFAWPLTILTSTLLNTLGFERLHKIGLTFFFHTCPLVVQR